MNVPIQLSTTYKQNIPGKSLNGFEYQRVNNPTSDVTSKFLAELEYGKHCLLFSSGCAALSLLFSTLSSGDHVIAIFDVYGGTKRLIQQVFSKLGIESDFIDFGSFNVSKLDQAIKSNTKMIFAETPTNPMF